MIVVANWFNDVVRQNLSDIAGVALQKHPLVVDSGTELVVVWCRQSNKRHGVFQ